MHSLINCRSKDLSTSSKSSTNVIPSSSASSIMGKVKSEKGNFVKEDYNMPTPPPNTKLRNPPCDLNYQYDTSDTDDCESVGSNSSHLEVTNSTQKPTIYDDNLTMKENPNNNHPATKNARKKNNKKIQDGVSSRPESSLPTSKKNASSDVFSHETNHTTSNITNDIRSNKQPQVGELANGPHGINLDSFNKITRTGNADPSSTRDAQRHTPRMKSNNAKKSIKETIEKPIDYTYLDEGDGGGPPNLTGRPYIIKKLNDNHYHLSQHQNEEDQGYVDQGDGGGFHSNNQLLLRRGRHGISERHKRQSRNGSRGISRSRSTGSRGSNRSRSGRHGRHKRLSRSKSNRSRSKSNRSRGSSRSRSGSQGSSRGSSQGSRGSRSRHSRRGRTGHRRKSKGGSGSSGSPRMSGLSALRLTKPYPANWRCFGRRPPGIHEFRPLGEVRVKNVRPAGKLMYLMRNADEKHGCQGPSASDEWDTCYGLAKPITDAWSTPLPYGTQIIRAGDIDPYFCPSRGDLVIINPAQNYYRAMKSGYVMTYLGHSYSFGVGDLIVRLGRFMPNREYIPYGNLELYMHTQTREMRLLGRQPFLLVDFNYHNLDYESPGKHLAIGTFLNESFFPRRGDIVIRGGAWAENYPNTQRKHHSSVKYWRPRMEFLPNDMLLRPYVDIGRKVYQSGKKFYWGAAELYTYSGKGLAWAYWGRDHHICDTPYPREQEHGIKSGHHKDEVGHYGDNGGGYSHGHQANDGCHSEHNLSHKHRRHGHQADDDCHREHELSRHPRR